MDTNTTEATTELRVPSRFWSDHVDRTDAWDLEECEVRCTSKYVVVRLTDEQLRDLASDASYYVAVRREMDACYRGLATSAAATLQVLRDAGKSFGY